MLAHFSVRLNLVSIDFLRLRWNKSRLNQGWSEVHLWDTVSRSIAGALRSFEVVDTRWLRHNPFRGTNAYDILDAPGFRLTRKSTPSLGAAICFTALGSFMFTSTPWSCL